MDEVKILCVGQLELECSPEMQQEKKRHLLLKERSAHHVPGTPLVNSAEQDSSRNVFWFSSSVKFVSSAISAWLCDETTRCNTRFSCVFISFNVGYVFSRQLIMRINLIFLAVILIPFIMINLFEKSKILHCSQKL